MTAPVDPIAVALLVTRTLETLQIPHTVGGSIASSIAGEPRSTIDIDVVAALAEPHIAALVAALSQEFYVDESAMRRAVRERGTVNLIHHATHLKVDIFIAGGTVLDEQQLARRREVVVGPRTYAPRSPPGGHPPSEAALVSRGGELSDRQWRDILGIIRVQGSRLDRPYLDANAPRLHVEDLLARALCEGEADT